MATATWPTQWVSVGKKWFEWRSWSPIPLFLLLLVMPPDFTWDVRNEWGLALALFGAVAAESLRVWAVGYAGSATRTRGNTVPVLVTAGPYRLVRNPLYIANIVLYTSCGFAFGFVGLSVVIFLYSALQYTCIVAFEEDLLLRTFGEPYALYLSKVNRWIPSTKSKCPSSEHQFNLERGLRSERSTFCTIGLMLLLFILKQVLF